MSADTPAAEAPGAGAPDPTRFSTSKRPARVRLLDASEPTLVADAQIVDAGWLRVQTWAGAVRYYPPQQVRTVERVAVETYTPEGEPDTFEVARIADEGVRERARELTGQPTTDADGRAVIADD